jgi:hypothetical protein
MKMSFAIVIPIVILAAIIFAAFYIFNIYEVKYSVSNKTLTKENPESIIEAIPLNSFGDRAPFRKAPFTIKIISGDSLIEISDGENVSQKKIRIKTDSISGEVELDLKSKFDLFPVRKKIKIN